MRYLLDTNIVSETIKSAPNENVRTFLQEVPPHSLYFSVLSLGEIRCGIEKLKIKDKKHHDTLIIWFENKLIPWFGPNILPVTEEVADCWGHLVGNSPRKLPAIDSLLAATCLTFNLKLVTRNVKDFPIPHLEIINPWL
jgi:predicted nucleic acid-binding protein